MDCKEQLGIDLHIHSDASDGTFSPSEILGLAQEQNLGAIAITDHDTIKGAREAVAAGIPSSIRFLTGIEISANPPPSFPCSGSFHILGYGLGLDDPILNQTLEVLQNARRERNPQMIRRLNRLGIDISLNEVTARFKGGQISRPHIAFLMLEKKFVSSIDEAFDNYLGKGKAAYVDKYRVDCGKALKMIRGAGGVPVLAHPGLLSFHEGEPIESLSPTSPDKPVPDVFPDTFPRHLLSGKSLPPTSLIGGRVYRGRRRGHAFVGDMIRTLKAMGLRGIESHHPEHTPSQVAFYAKLAKRHGLLVTGGTDFHGSLKPDIQMGSGRGDFFVPYALYEKLKSEIGMRGEECKDEG